jgi:TatD DNase family protein
MNRKLTDIHAHLEQYTAEELQSVLRRAGEAGVGWILTSGLDFKTSMDGVELAVRHEGLLAAVGVHPWTAAQSFPADFPGRFSELLNRKVTVAVGEVGLDFVDNLFSGISYRDNPELCGAQERALRMQIALACGAGLPLIVHCRGAYPQMISILKEESAARVGGVIHNFDESREAASRLLGLGFLLSFGGAVSYPEASALRDLVRYVPLEGMLLETDSPYMPLYRQEAQKNEPANVAQVARAVAAIKGIDPEELIDRTFENFRALLKPESRERGAAPRSP